MMPNKIAFLKRGSFSHINDSVINGLVNNFPDFSVDVIDVYRDLMGPWHVRNVFAAMWEYGPELCLHRKRVWRTLPQTTYLFKQLKSRLTKRLVGNGFAFSFQTQSVFDASTKSIPNFVYTDHTALAQLRYRDFHRRQLPTKSWIALEAGVYRNATINFTTSQFAARSIIEDYGCKPNQVICVHCGQNTRIPVDPATKSYDSKNILFVGREWERKGGPDLIKAFKLVLKSHPDATLTIVGCSPGVDVPNCNVLGNVPLSKVAECYDKASVFCLPSRLEPSSIALTEASAWGLPVISTDIGGTPERVVHGKTGYLVQPGDIEQLTKALINLLSQPQQCRALGQAQLQLTNTVFTWDKVIADMKHHIEHVTQQGYAGKRGTGAFAGTTN
jgi:glycosyltransferase involved in cell wall biosynthesis